MFIGDNDQLSDPRRREANEETLRRVRSAFAYAERPDRFLYGSDWPLAPMLAYRDIIRSAIPEEHQEGVFRENAVQLFFGGN